MLEMAAHTVFAVRVVHVELRVIAVLVLERFGNLFVTIQALKSWSAGTELMAGIALCSPA